jgi:hypothetical protein
MEYLYAAPGQVLLETVSGVRLPLPPSLPGSRALRLVDQLGQANTDHTQTLPRVILALVAQALMLAKGAGARRAYVDRRRRRLHLRKRRRLQNGLLRNR